jgi:branched-chain amino acid transport system substrate-binding protein
VALDLMSALTALLVDRLHGRPKRSCGHGIWEATPRLGAGGFVIRRGLPAAVVAGALWLALVASAEAQPPIRIGASLSQSGTFALLGQNQLRGYQLCVKHTNDKGGVLGRRLELIAEDDRSDPATAARIYEKLISQTKVDAVIGPYSSPITEAVADVTEKHRMAMVAPGASTTSIFKKGRKFIFMLLSRAEVFFEGLIDMAARRGLKTVALTHEDTLFPKATAQGAMELAKKRGLSVVLVEAYPKGTTDFSAILTKVRAANPDVLASATYFDDAVALTRQLKDANVNPRMFGVTVGGDLPKFYEMLGRSAEFVYGAAPWELELMALLRAGELVPVARRYPGAREFVESYRKEFPGAELSYHSAGGYGGCQVLVEAIRRAGSLNGEQVRTAILNMNLNTVYGGFKVDRDGLQIAHTMLVFQWQDGKKVIVWPDELAPGKPRFPTPPWNQRQ